MLLAGVLGAGPGAGSAIAGNDAVAIERRIDELEIRRQIKVSAKDTSGVLDVIRDMAALDPIHPKVYLNTVLLQKSLADLDGAGAVMRTLGAPEGPGVTYGNGLVLFFENDLDGARAEFEEALGRYTGLGHDAGMAACETALGNVDRKEGNLDRAAAHYETARSHLEKIQDELGMASVLGASAKVDRLRGHPELAAAEHRKILEIRERLGDVEGQAKTLNEIGAASFAAGDAKAGIAAYERALELRRLMKDKPGEVATLMLLAVDEEGVGDPAAAIPHMEAALALAPEAGETARIPPIRLAIGRMNAEDGRYEEARTLLGKLVDEESASKSPEIFAEARYWLALSLRKSGEYGEAARCLEAGLRQADLASSAKWKAALLTERGVVRMATGEIAGAIADQEAASALNAGEKNRRGELTNLNNLAALHRLLGDAGRARSEMEETLRIAVELGDRQSIARGENNLGVLQLEAGEAAPALERLTKAGKIWAGLGNAGGAAMARANAADAEAALGRSEQARASFEEALKGYRDAGDRRGEAATLNQVGAFRSSGGDTEGAAKAHRDALRIAEEDGLADEAWRAEAGLASALAAAGRQAEALRHAIASLDRVEAIRAGLVADDFKVGFLEGKQGLYEQALDLSLSAGAASAARTEDAFEIAERARARGLLDLLAASRASPEASLPEPLQAEIASARDRISAASFRLAGAGNEEQSEAARKELRGAEEGLERLVLRIRLESPRHAELIDPQPVKIARLQAALSGGELLVEFFTGERRSWVFEISRDDARVLALAPAPDLSRSVRAYLAELQRPGTGLFDGAGRRKQAEELARMLMPFAIAKGVKRLLVVPDGLLHHLPFESLVREGRYLVQDFEVVVAPSASTLVELRGEGPRTTSGSFAGLGDPAIGAEDARYPPLPSARAEVERVAGLFPADRELVLLGAEATRSAVLVAPLDRYRYVHFATHGWLDDRDPSRSGLILGGGGTPPTGSLLSVADVFGLRLSADVVALSACRSGSGEIKKGEGVIGLTRAFIEAGARSVLVSLWNVDDASTADLMYAFYSGMAEGRAPAEALRAAKIAFLESDRPLRKDPYRWAPFVLVGGGTIGKETRQ